MIKPKKLFHTIAGSLCLLLLLSMAACGQQTAEINGGKFVHGSSYYEFKDGAYSYYDGTSKPSSSSSLSSEGTYEQKGNQLILKKTDSGKEKTYTILSDRFISEPFEGEIPGTQLFEVSITSQHITYAFHKDGTLLKSIYFTPKSEAMEFVGTYQREKENLLLTFDSGKPVMMTIRDNRLHECWLKE